MWDWLTMRAGTTPEATGLVDATTDESWSYAALDAAVDGTAGRLARLGIDPGDRLGVLMDTRPAFARLAFATARLGAVLVPLNARLAASELAVQCAAAGLGALVCEAGTEADAVAAVAAGDVDFPVVTVDDPDSERARRLPEPVPVEPVSVERSDPRLVLFTSGTTGDPKSVVLTEGNLLASATASAFRLGVVPGDGWLSPLPMYHVGGLSPLLRSTLYGTTTVLTRGFDAEGTVTALRSHRCSGVSLVPTMLARLLDVEGVATDGLPDSLRFVLLGGAPISRDLVSRCADLDIPVCPTYGLTEAASQVTTAAPGEAFDRPETVGRPLAFTEVTVVGPDGTPLPPGEAGELVVRGPTVTPGYYDDPEANAEAFGEYGLHTGDVGVRDEDGYLRVVGRVDDRILTGGENVDPGAVAAVLREHPAVEDAAVVGFPDPEWGECVGALVVPAADAGLDVAAVRRHGESRLADFERPRLVAVADALPRTASGTVDREAVRRLLRRDGVEV